MDEDRKIITMQDEEGNDHVMELIDFVDVDDVTYAVFTPYEENEPQPEEDDEEIDVVVFKVVEEGDEISLEIVSDMEKCQQILEAFTEQVASYELEEEAAEPEDGAADGE